MILPNKSRFITKLLRDGGKPSAMDRRMDSFAHGGYDGLDGGDRDASAGKKKHKYTKRQKDKSTKTGSNINFIIIRQEQTPLCRMRTAKQLVRYLQLSSIWYLFSGICYPVSGSSCRKTHAILFSESDITITLVFVLMYFHRPEKKLGGPAMEPQWIG